RDGLDRARAGAARSLAAVQALTTARRVAAQHGLATGPAGGALVAGVAQDVRLGHGPVVVVVVAAAGGQPAHVRSRTLDVRLLELLLGQVPVVPAVVVLLGDAEIDERPVPEIAEAHPCCMLTPPQAADGG